MTAVGRGDKPAKHRYRGTDIVVAMKSVSLMPSPLLHNNQAIAQYRGHGGWRRVGQGRSYCANGWRLWLLCAGRSDRLQCHLALANPTWQRIQNGAQVLAVFQGPNAYISSSYVTTKAETGRVVPTWNYQAVHVQGKVQVIQDPDRLKHHLSQLTSQHEATMTELWSRPKARKIRF